jgi:superfamily I DNA/RNA helicase
VRFYERKEIKDILAYLRVVANPQDRISLLRILNVPTRGIGATTIERIEQAAAGWGVSFSDAIGRLLEAPAESPAEGLALAAAPRRALAGLWETCGISGAGMSNCLRAGRPPLAGSPSC